MFTTTTRPGPLRIRRYSGEDGGVRTAVFRRAAPGRRDARPGPRHRAAQLFTIEPPVWPRRQPRRGRLPSGALSRKRFAQEFRALQPVTRGRGGALRPLAFPRVERKGRRVDAHPYVARTCRALRSVLPGARAQRARSSVHSRAGRCIAANPCVGSSARWDRGGCRAFPLADEIHAPIGAINVDVAAA